MTAAERQARYRAARAADKPVVRSIIAVGPGAGPTTSPASWNDRLGMRPGWIACQRTCETARSLKHCRRSAIWTSANFRRSSHRAASAGTNRSLYHFSAACTGGSTGTPRAPLRQPRDGHSATPGSPLWTTGTSRRAGGQFWTPIGGQDSTPIDTKCTVVSSSTRKACRLTASKS
jgi:hypothetical protein